MRCAQFAAGSQCAPLAPGERTLTHSCVRAGDTSYGLDDELLCHVWSAAPQSRSDRRRDRVRDLFHPAEDAASLAPRKPHLRLMRRRACAQVETTPEQLAAASQAAEHASAATGTLTRVIGWYHSHPHITVLPSAVGAFPCAPALASRAGAPQRL